MASTSEYWVGDMIGEGSFGVVVYGRYKQEGSTQTDHLHVAIKCIDKHSLQRQPSMAMAVVQEQRLLKRLKEKQQHTTAKNEHTSSENATTTSNTDVDIMNEGKNTFIVDLYASFHDRECVYLVLECCCGGTLQDLFDHFERTNCKNTESKCIDQSADTSETITFTTTKLLLEATQYYGIQLILGISFIHACSIIHCDIKPSNVLLTNYGSIKISDFGSSIDLLNSNIDNNGRVVTNDPKTLSALKTPTKSITRMSIPRGTAAYAAPELNRQLPEQPSHQIDDGSRYATPNVAVDLWSLGCILCASLLVESHHQSPFDVGSEAMSFQAQTDYCAILDATTRYTKLFGKTEDANNGKEGELLHAFKGVIAALLHPNAEERIKFAKQEPQKDSSATESTLSLQQQRNISSVTNTVEGFSMLYPNLNRNTVWGIDAGTPQQPLSLKTDFLPPTPTWWIKNSSAVAPTKLTNSNKPNTTTSDSLDPINSNILVDGSIGWNAFLV